jgi:hypothetical protein
MRGYGRGVKILSNDGWSGNSGIMKRHKSRSLVVDRLVVIEIERI